MSQTPIPPAVASPTYQHVCAALSAHSAPLRARRLAPNPLPAGFPHPGMPAKAQSPESAVEDEAAPGSSDALFLSGSDPGFDGLKRWAVPIELMSRRPG